MTDTQRTAAGIIADVESAVVAETGYPASHVRQFVSPALRYLLREYGGDRLPKAPRRYPVAEILAAHEAGKTKRWICRHFHVGRSTLYRIIESGNQEKAD